MEKTTITDFIKTVKRVSDIALRSWGKGTVVTRVGERSFMMSCTHTWEHSYCNWTDGDFTERLMSALESIGVTNLMGGVHWNRVCLQFDLPEQFIIEE